jgi:hypothetical protein
MTSQSSQPTNARILRSPVILLIFAVCITLIILNIAIYGQSDYWTTFVSTIFNPLFAFIVTILAIVLLVQVLPNPRARALWLGLIIGWACWTVAEIIWTYYFIKGQEVPYPSLADLFWCVGYIPMSVALALRLHSTRGKASRWNQVLIILIGFVIIGFTVIAILLPIIRANDPSARLESFLNLFYPFGDVVLIILALLILFSTNRSTFSISWFWISLGFLMSSFSDLFFSYLNIIGMYYPDGHATLMSVFLVDLPYTISYLLFMVGLVALAQMKSTPVSVNLPQMRQ